MRRLFFLLLAVIVCSAGAEDSLKTLKITSDTTLRSNLIVPENTICVLKPGITLRFDGYWGIQVQGKLVARGRENSPIVIKGIDWNKGSEKANWRGIEVIGASAEAILKNCRLEGAYRNLLQESWVSIDSCRFTGNHYALYCEKNTDTQIRNAIFTDNNTAVTVDGAQPVLYDVVVRENKLGLHCISDCAVVSDGTVIEKNAADRKIETFDSQNTSSPRRVWDMLLQLF
ncbi:MAG: right-handed parallel beta-helix repeat-containing protein [Chitinispirillaceae bacterium]